MNRIMLHLLGSILLGVVLLGVAEMVGRSEAQASSPRVVAPEKTSPAAPTGKDALIERCWELAGLTRTALKPVARPTESTARRQPFGWDYLPARTFAG